MDLSPAPMQPQSPQSDELHRRSLVVWDVPSAIECGKPFTIKLGVKCADGCQPAGWPVEVRDGDGVTRATVALGDALWPGTAALYYVDLQLTAPAEVGLFGWEAVAPALLSDADDASGHAESRMAFSLRAVPAPDFRLTVIAIDRKSQAPVPGVKVVVHPYQARTNAAGVAELDLPRGQYRLFVSGKDFFPFRTDGELTSDLTLRAELDLDLGPTDAELWS